MAKYWIKEPGLRRPFGDYVSFLWGDQDCDTDGDAKSPEDRDWTELTVINRRSDLERVDVDPLPDNPLTLLIKSDDEHLAARLAYILAATAGGTLSDSLGGHALRRDALIPNFGDFDLAAALERLG